MWLRVFFLFTAGLLALLARPPVAGAQPWIGVKGNQLVNRAGVPVRLTGVNRDGSERRCQEAGEVFEGPTDAASIAVMKRWHVNAVRIPLNESCWLGVEGVPASASGAAYRTAIRAYVETIQNAGLYVILELHVVAPGDQLAESQLPMPDADHAPEFWRSVATEYREDRSVIFDLFNEPRPGVSWECWQSGCTLYEEGIGFYQSAGMTELLEAVRSTGARQPVMLSGLEWAANLNGWLSHEPYDPAHALVASNHTYRELSPCYGACRAAVAEVARHVPVITAELGQIDCRDDYIDEYMDWADRHGISYLAWAWNAEPGAPCDSGPSLIENYAGLPSSFGIGFREHLRKLWRAERAAAAKQRRRGKGAASPKKGSARTPRRARAAAPAPVA